MEWMWNSQHMYVLDARDASDIGCCANRSTVLIFLILLSFRLVGLRFIGRVVMAISTSFNTFSLSNHLSRCSKPRVAVRSFTVPLVKVTLKLSNIYWMTRMD